MNLFLLLFAGIVAGALIVSGTLADETAPSRFSEPEFRFRVFAPPNLVAAAFSPDGRLLATTSYDPRSGGAKLGPVRVWDVETGRQLAEIPVENAKGWYSDWYGRVGFTGDGKRLVVFQPNEKVLVADPLTGKPDQRIMNILRGWRDASPEPTGESVMPLSAMLLGLLAVLVVLSCRSIVIRRPMRLAG